MGMHLALRILVHPTEAELQHRLRVLVNTDDGQSMAVVEMLINPPPPEARSQLRPGEELSLPLALNLSQVGLPEPRDYIVEILIDGIHQASVPFNVKEAAAL